MVSVHHRRLCVGLSTQDRGEVTIDGLLAQRQTIATDDGYESGQKCLISGQNYCIESIELPEKWIVISIISVGVYKVGRLFAEELRLPSFATLP